MFESGMAHSPSSRCAPDYVDCAHAQRVLSQGLRLHGLHCGLPASECVPPGREGR